MKSAGVVAGVVMSTAIRCEPEKIAESVAVSNFIFIFDTEPLPHRPFSLKA